MIYAHLMTMVNTNINILELSFVFPTWSLVLWKYYLRENLRLALLLAFPIRPYNFLILFSSLTIKTTKLIHEYQSDT
jgi:hypothetical protein